MVFITFFSCMDKNSTLISPKAADGVIDLRTWDLDRDGPVKLDGEWKFYYENTGNIFQELSYVEGKFTGLQKYYYESAELSAIGEMKDGLKVGEWTWYFENGNISSTVEYKQDKKEGKQIMYEELGEIVKEEYYNNGELIEEQ